MSSQAKSGGGGGGGGGFRLPSYQGGSSSRGVTSTLYVTPSQLALQKTALMRKSLSSRCSKEQLAERQQHHAAQKHLAADRAEKQESDKEHLDVYENIPKGLSPKQYQEWAKEWLPRLSSRRAPRDYAAFALGHVPPLIKSTADKDEPLENISGPLVYHFNPGTTTTREPRTEYLDLYMEYKTKRAQSAKLPKHKRFVGSTRKVRTEEPKWEFLRPDDEPVQGSKLQTPAGQMTRNTPTGSDLNQFLDSVRDKTYISFCQRTAERERERARTPRTAKAKSAGVKLDNISLRRNKLGILEPPQIVPSKRGNLRQGHSFDLTNHRVNEFEPALAPDFGEAIVPIKNKPERGGERVFLTEEDAEATSDDHRTTASGRKGVLIRNSMHKLYTRVPNEREDSGDTGEEDMDTDAGNDEQGPGFLISGHRIRKGNTPDESTSGETGNGLNKDGRLHYPVPNGTHADRDDLDKRHEESGDAADDTTGAARPTKSRELVIKFATDDKGRIESLRTVTSERIKIQK